MAMDISNRTVKYCGRPWDFIRKADWLSSGGQDQRDLIPWENRTWFLSPQANRRQDALSSPQGRSRAHQGRGR